jgi:hypothetical protein
MGKHNPSSSVMKLKENLDHFKPSSFGTIPVEKTLQKQRFVSLNSKDPKPIQILHK